MKIVLDANIFISSLFWGGNPRLIVERVIAGIDELFITNEILDEITGVISRPKFHATSDEINYFIDSIKEIGNIITPKKHSRNKSRDKNDDKYIECGIAANADYIISGDIHLLELGKIHNTEIITAKNYPEIVK